MNDTKVQSGSIIVLILIGLYSIYIEKSCVEAGQSVINVISQVQSAISYIILHKWTSSRAPMSSLLMGAIEHP